MVFPTFFRRPGQLVSATNQLTKVGGSIVDGGRDRNRNAGQTSTLARTPTSVATVVIEKPVSASLILPLSAEQSQLAS